MIRLFVADIFESICCNIEIAFMRSAYIYKANLHVILLYSLINQWISESTRCHWIYDRIGSKTHYAQFLYSSYIFLLFVIIEISKVWIFYCDLKYILSILSYYNYNSFLLHLSDSDLFLYSLLYSFCNHIFHDFEI